MSTTRAVRRTAMAVRQVVPISGTETILLPRGLHRASPRRVRVVSHFRSAARNVPQSAPKAAISDFKATKPACEYTKRTPLLAVAPAANHCGRDHSNRGSHPVPRVTENDKVRKRQ